MLFNSVEFALFLPTVFLIYWFVVNKSLSAQNFFIVVASYFFYGWFDWRFLSLVIISTTVDYLVALALSRENNHAKRRALFVVSIFLNLGFLGFFKYYNFFLENFALAFTSAGIPVNHTYLRILLPAGISFYTFQTLSYVIDVYRKKINATKDFIQFAAFVSFFPQLVAGPIERATQLLPQFSKRRSFDYAKAIDGMKQILWGLFKKVVIADNCAKYVNMVFGSSDDYAGAVLFFAMILFTIQIYCDFSAYCDIALGTARLFGFELMQNFAFPFFSRNIAELWKRWHISLYNWFREYIYIPLGGNKGGKLKTIRNVFIVSIISGLWHGASWNFVIWGLLNAIYFLPGILSRSKTKYTTVVAEGKLLPSVPEFFAMLKTFLLFAFSMIFFRLQTVGQAYDFITNMFSGLADKQTYLKSFLMFQTLGYGVLGLTVFCFVMEWLGRTHQHALERIGAGRPKPLRYAFYYIIMMIIALYGNFDDTPFIYFQF